MTCHLGDFEEYALLRRQISDREAALARQGTALRRAAAADALERLRPGDVVRVPSGKFAGVAVVLDPGTSASGRGDGPRPTVLTEARQVRRLSLVDFPVAVEPLARLRIPPHIQSEGGDVAARPGRGAAGESAIPGVGGRDPGRR